MTDDPCRSPHSRISGAVFACTLLLSLSTIRPVPAQDAFGEVVEVRTGFARVTVAEESGRPEPDDFVVTWKRDPQPVREILGGPDSPIEIGIAIDLSASMHESLEAMRPVISEFLRSELSAADRVFVVSLSDRAELVAEGVDASLASIETLTSDLRPGSRQTRFFEGLNHALSSFRNTSPRAVLLVASDACDSPREAHAAEGLLERAADLAIPIVLVAPHRRDCRTTHCEPTPSGEWKCREATTAPTVRVRQRDPFNPTRPPLEVSSGALQSPATATRDRFADRLEGRTGSFLVARSQAEWRAGIESVHSSLDRQWTVVFEPRSDAVRSSEVRVKVRRPSRSGHDERSADLPRDEAPVLALPVSAAAEGLDRSLSTSAPPARTISAPPTTSEKELTEGEPPIIHEQIGVEVVSIDLVATDRRGRRVLDLAREEFVLEVDGRPRSLDYFSAPRASLSGSDETATTSLDSGLEPGEIDTIPPVTSPTPDGTVFLIIDRSTVDFHTLERVLNGFRGLVAAPGLAGRRFVVASFGRVPALHTAGTTDPEEVERALDEAGRAATEGTLRRLERRHLEEEVHESSRMSAEMLSSQIRALEDQEVMQQSAFVAMLQDLVTTSADANGPNTLLIASEGFSAQPGAYLRHLLRSISASRHGAMLSSEDAAPTRHLSLLVEVERLAKTLQERRVTVYTLIPTPELTGPGSAQFRPRTTGTFAGAAPREEVYLAEFATNLVKLADTTGGARISISTDLEERIRAIPLDRQASYSLGFDTGPEAGFESHEIRIRTTRPHTELRYRASYRRLSPAEQLQAALAAAARFGTVNPALPIELRVDSAPGRPRGRRGNRRVPVVLDIPLDRLSLRPSADGGSDLGDLTVQFAVQNSSGILVRGSEEALEISVPRPESGQAREQTWSHQIEVELPEGPASVGALVFEKSTGAWATASCAIPAAE